MEAISGQLGKNGVATTWLPVAGFALAAATIGYGFAARASGTELGASLAPFLWDWRPRAHALALPAAALLALGASLAPRLRSPAVGPLAFAGLHARARTRAAARARQARAPEPRASGTSTSSATTRPAREYLPALPALDFGARFFLDTFAEIGTSLPVHAIGHPPGLLLMLHWLGIDGPRGNGGAHDRRGSAGDPAHLPARARAARRAAGAHRRAALRVRAVGGCSTAPPRPTRCTPRLRSPRRSRSRSP